MSQKRVLFISGRQGGKALAQAKAVEALREAGVEVVEASAQSFAVSDLADAVDSLLVGDEKRLKEWLLERWQNARRRT